jgi:hypothetical protein
MGLTPEGFLANGISLPAVNAFKSKFTYFQRTIPSFEQYLEPLQDVINDLFVPAILGQDTPLSDELMACFSLPTSNTLDTLDTLDSSG